MAVRAKKNPADPRRRLAEQGQTVQAGTGTSMSQVESYLQRARATVGRGDLASAKESLPRAEYTLKRVFRAGGN